MRVSRLRFRAESAEIECLGTGTLFLREAHIGYGPKKVGRGSGLTLYVSLVQDGMPVIYNVPSRHVGSPARARYVCLATLASLRYVARRRLVRFRGMVVVRCKSLPLKERPANICLFDER